MTERPINFNVEMIRSILEGRKSVTRRPVKNQVGDSVNCGDGCYIPLPTCERVAHLHLNSILSLCPFGVPGDRLWVREVWAYNGCLNCGTPHYQASEPDYAQKSMMSDGWKSPVTMPRWASRITLEVTGVRVERVQDISEDDAKREGIKISGGWDAGETEYGINYRGPFSHVWNSIYAAKGLGWDANPWVWVVEFTRVEVPHA